MLSAGGLDSIAQLYQLSEPKLAYTAFQWLRWLLQATHNICCCDCYAHLALGL
jgi:hypothetical protein